VIDDPEVQRSAVPVVHEVVRHESTWMLNDCVNAVIAKFNPMIVTEAPPLCGVLRDPNDNSGPSKVKCPAPVPDKPATVSEGLTPTNFSLLLPIKAEDSNMHEIEEMEVQLAVVQPCESKTVVAVKSAVPKSRPETVTEAHAVLGMFCDLTNDEAGASNVKEPTLTMVPAIAPTVMVAPETGEDISDVRHRVDVPELQDAVLQSDIVNTNELEKSEDPKPSPDTVIEVPPECGMLPYASETIGALKLNTRILEPTSPDTVTCKGTDFAARRLVKLDVRQLTEDEDVHADVSQRLIWESSSAADSVVVATPKFRPETVIEVLPERPPLAGCTRVMLGASKVKNTLAVAVATCAQMCRNFPLPVPAESSTRALAEVQEVVCDA
jgi:hypothetical protein